MPYGIGGAFIHNSNFKKMTQVILLILALLCGQPNKTATSTDTTTVTTSDTGGDTGHIPPTPPPPAGS
jgi:hypothetical protein